MHWAAKLGHQLIMGWAHQRGEDWAALRAWQGPAGTSLEGPDLARVPGTYLLVLFPLNLTPPGTGAVTGMLLIAPGVEAVWGEMQPCFQHHCCAGPPGKVLLAL